MQTRIFDTFSEKEHIANVHGNTKYKLDRNILVMNDICKCRTIITLLLSVTLTFEETLDIGF